MTQKKLNDWLLDEASEGNAEMCKRIIEAGAMVDVQDKYGRTALDYATGKCKDMLKEAMK